MIEIPTVKWKEGGLFVRQGLPAVYHRVISRPLGIRERLLPTRVFMSLDQPMSTFHFSLPRGSIEREDGFSRVRERRRAEADEDHGPGRGGPRTLRL